MTETKIYCDRCGKVLSEMNDYPESNIEVAHKWMEKDLCGDCIETLWEYIETFFEGINK